MAGHRVLNRLARAPSWAWLLLLFAGSVALRFWVALDYPAPWILDDELIYIELAKSLAGIAEAHTHGVGDARLYFVYPALIAPAFALFDDPSRAYAALKFINCVVMSSAAIPAYLLARTVLDRHHSVLVSLLTLAVPSMIYTAAAMRENAYYPAFLWCALAIWRVLQKPSTGRQLVALSAITLAFFIRNQAVALLAAYVLALVTQALLERRSSPDEFGSTRRSHLWSYRCTWITISLPLLFVLVGELLGAGLIERLAGQNSFVLSLPARLYEQFASRLPGVLMAHVADLDLYVGVLPFAALGVLTYQLLRGRIADPALRTLVQIAIWASLCNLLMVSAFLSLVDQDRIADRNLFVLTPFFFIALCRLILDSAANRSQLLKVCLVLSVLPLLLDFEAVEREFIVADSFAMLAFSKLQLLLGLGSSFAWVLALAVAAGALVLLLPRRAFRWLPLAVLLFLVALHSPIVRATHTASRVALQNGVPGDSLDWIDQAVGSDANIVAIWHNSESKHPYWQGAYFNRSLSTVMNFFGPGDQYARVDPTHSAPLDRLASSRLSIDPGSAQLLGPDSERLAPDYVLTHSSLELNAPVVVEDPERAMILYATATGVEVVAKTLGVSNDGWTRPTFAYQVFNSEEGLLELQLHSNSDVHDRMLVVTAWVEKELVGSTSLTPGSFKNFVVPYPSSRGGWCQVDFEVSLPGIPEPPVGPVDPHRLGVVCSSFERHPRPPIFGLFHEGLLADGWTGAQWETLLAPRESGLLYLRLWSAEDSGLEHQRVSARSNGELLWTGELAPGVQGGCELRVEPGFRRLELEVSPLFVPDLAVGNGDQRELGVVPGSFLFVCPAELRASLEGVYYDSWTEPSFGYEVDAIAGELTLYVESNPKLFEDGQWLVGSIEGVEVVRERIEGGAVRALSFVLPEREREGIHIDFEVSPTTGSLATRRDDDPRDLGLLLRGISFFDASQARRDTEGREALSREDAAPR